MAKAKRIGEKKMMKKQQQQHTNTLQRNQLNFNDVVGNFHESDKM